MDMTEQEKKEFEEFLQWKKEKAEKEQAEKDSEAPKPDTIGFKEEENKEEPVETPEPENNEDGINFTPIIIAVVLIGVLLLALAMCTSVSKKQPPVADVLEPLDTIAEIVDTMELPAKTWDFSISKDDMTDTNNIWATIRSADYVSQEFPYEGYTYASITVRYMKKYGYDVIIQITKGQITGSEYNGTDYITARFDGGSPKKYHFNEAADGSSEMVFLRNTSDFISKCKKAKDIKIDLPLYKGGRPTFTFHVDEPLVWRTE